MKMKKFVTILLALVLVFALAACAGNTESNENNRNTGSSQNAEDQSATSSNAGNESVESSETPDSNSDDTVSEPDNEPESSKILVAYFSATNNIEGVAQKLADGLGADLYEITPEQPYTDADLNYNDSDSRSSVEMNDPSARPAISGSVENMEQYDVVFIGYPIWWGIAAWPVDSFISANDFTGKTVIPFCTSSSSGLGQSGELLRDAAGTGNWLEGQRFQSRASKDTVKEWVASLEL